MLIYPAIDLREGRVVRLIQGNAERETDYAQDPVCVASSWAAQGARWIHVVDLDGAFAGRSQQGAVLQAIAAAVDVPVQFGGGLRSRQAIECALESGAARVVLGSVAVRDPELLRSAVSRYGARIAVAIDVRDGMVRTAGWQSPSSREPVEFARWLERLGVSRVAVTDIGRDGMLMGPNVELTSDIARETNLCVVASGGVSGLEDIRTLARTGVEGVIVGKALYEKRFTLVEALQAAEEVSYAG